MDWNFLLLTVVPACAALLVKAGLFAYAYKSVAKAQRTRLYLYLLTVLSVQNAVVIPGYFALKAGTIPTGEATIFYTSLFASISLLYHLAYATSLEGIRHDGKSWTVATFHICAIALGLMAIFSDYLIAGYTNHGYVISRIPGPLYFLFEIFAFSAFIGALSLLTYGSRFQQTAQKRLRSTIFLLAIVPMIAAMGTVLALFRLGITTINFAIVSPLVITYFLGVTAYATHQSRLFDIQFYIPWSRVRRRKTAFYDRIRAMIAEVADLTSVNHAVERLADTLRCPVALVGGPTPVLAASGANGMASLPFEKLRTIDHIVVTNEISDTMPALHAAMKRHGVAAVVPFYPHTQNASSWLLLGDSFSDHVYTPLDFRMVERLFDRMAELFLDKLLTMRAQLADAHLQIRTLEFRLQQTETNVTSLRGNIETLSRENFRLIREQPADSLVALPRISHHETTIALLGRDKGLLKRLRQRFPQLEQFAGPDSVSFQRKPAPAVLLCQIESDALSTWQKQAEKIFGSKLRDTAVLFFGSGAKEFAFVNRRNLLGTLVEVLSPSSTEEAMIRKLEALALLRESRVAVPTPDYPLLGLSAVFREAMTEARRIAGFMDPVCIITDDAAEAIAVGNYMQECARTTGAFRVLQTAKLLAHEDKSDGRDELRALIEETANGTILIDDIAGITNETWDRLLFETNNFSRVRVVARCSTAAAKSADVLFKPLRPLVLQLPVLRERREDLPLLVHYYTLQFNLQADDQRYLSKADLDDLMDKEYPHDLVSLQRSVGKYLSHHEQHATRNATVTPLDSDMAADKTLEEHVSELEKRLITETLQQCSGNKSKAARVLGLKPNTLHYKLERYGLLRDKE